MRKSPRRLHGAGFVRVRMTGDLPQCELSLQLRLLRTTLYRINALPLYRFTALPLYRFTALQLYSFTALPLYSFTALHPYYPFTAFTARSTAYE
jgi:hypothetical protein